MKLSYISKGEGEVLIFIHSYAWDKNMWEPQIEFLSSQYRCIAVDLPGHGESELLKSDEKITLRDIAKGIVDLIEKLNIDSYSYIGLSVGGMLAPYIYEMDKNKVKNMVIMDSYSGSESREMQKMYSIILDTILEEKRISEIVAAKVAPLFFSPETSKTKNRLYIDFYNRLINISSDKIETLVKVGEAIFNRENSMDLLKKIDIPVTLLVGEYDIPRPVSESEEMLKVLKNSSLFIVENAGHISNLENIEMVNKILKEFL